MKKKYSLTSLYRSYKFLFPAILIALIMVQSCKKKEDDDDNECPVCPVVSSIVPSNGNRGDTITISGTNFLIASNIVKFNGVTAQVINESGTSIQAIVPAQCGTGPVTVAHDADLVSNSNIVFTYVPLYIVSTFAGFPDSSGNSGTSTTNAFFNSPRDIVWSTNNVLYIVQSSFYGVRSINLNNNAVGSISLGGNCFIGTPHGMEIDSNNILYIANSSSEQICMLSGSTCNEFAGTYNSNGFSDGPLLQSLFNNPMDIAQDKSNPEIFYVADFANHCVRKISLTTDSVTTFAGGSGLYGDLDGPLDSAKFSNPISVLADNNVVYVIDQIAHKIRKIENGYASTLAGGVQGSADGTGSQASFSYPTKMTFDKDGNILVCDNGNSKIRKVTRAGVVTTLAGGSSGIADGEGTQAQFRNITGICVDNSGNIYVTDASAHTIRKISLE